jgi:uncharacterized protein
LKFYIDTSVLAAYYCPEPLSEKADEFLTSYVHPCISGLTEVELFSTVSRKVREGGMSRKDAGRIMARFIAHVDKNFYDYLTVEQHHYRLARDWIGLFKTGLKTLDALHLAIASAEGLTLVTADEGLMKSAKALGADSILME